MQQSIICGLANIRGGENVINGAEAFANMRSTKSADILEPFANMNFVSLQNGYRMFYNLFDNRISWRRPVVYNSNFTNLIDGGEMFSGSAGDFKSEKWNFSNLVNGSAMFRNARWSSSSSWGYFDVNINSANLEDASCMFENFITSAYSHTIHINCPNMRSAYRMFAEYSGSIFINDMSNCTNVLNMFQITNGLLNTCSTLNIQNTNIDIDNAWDISNWFNSGKCPNSVQIINSNIAIRKLPVFRFSTNLTNANLTGLNVTLVNNMENLFYQCINLQTVNCNQWDTSNVTTMSSAFAYCNRLRYLYGLSNWNISNVSNTAVMFHQASIGYNQGQESSHINFKKWDFSNVINMTSMFSYSNIRNMDFSSTNLSNVARMSYIFMNCKDLTTVNMKNLNLGNILSTTNFASIFAECSTLNYVDLSNVYLGNMTIGTARMSDLFVNCNYLTTVNMANCNLAMVNNMSYLFVNKAYLRNFNGYNMNIENCLDISNMFGGCTALEDFPDYNWNLANVKYLSSVFGDCINLQSVDVSNWNISNALSVSGMFRRCNNLSDASVDSIINMCLSASNLTYKNMSNMNGYSPFYGSNIYNTRYVNRWSELTEAGWTY